MKVYDANGIEKVVGLTGPAGPTGSQGPIGPPVFLTAEAGEDGAPGSPGAVGATGAPGSPGATGSTGPAVFLLDEGDQGETGPPGPAGATGAAGAPGSGVIVDRLNADVPNATTTLAKITGLDQTLGVGTWVFIYYIIHQAAVTTTGIKWAVTHTGTAAPFVLFARFANTLNTASNALQDQSVLVGPFVTGSVMASRIKNDTLGPTSDADVIDADMLTIIEGIMVVTVSGDIQLFSASEVAATTTVKIGSSLLLFKTA